MQIVIGTAVGRLVSLLAKAKDIGRTFGGGAFPGIACLLSLLFSRAVRTCLLPLVPVLLPWVSSLLCLLLPGLFHGKTVNCNPFNGFFLKPFNGFNHCLIIIAHKADGTSAAFGASGTANPVGIGLGCLGKIKVYNLCHS